MSTETITLEIDSEAARAFTSASAEDRGKLAVLFRAMLKEYVRDDAPSLKETMDETSLAAQERGLTPEILESILKEE
jgi:hypothetical protein